MMLKKELLNHGVELQNLQGPIDPNRDLIDRNRMLIDPNRGILTNPIINLQDLQNLISLQNLAGQCMSATELIKQGEGLRTKMYYDTMGIPTVCYGYNLKNGRGPV